MWCDMVIWYDLIWCDKYNMIWCCMHVQFMHFSPCLFFVVVKILLYLWLLMRKTSYECMVWHGIIRDPMLMSYTSIYHKIDHVYPHLVQKKAMFHGQEALHQVMLRANIDEKSLQEEHFVKGKMLVIRNKFVMRKEAKEWGVQFGATAAGGWKT